MKRTLLEVLGGLTVLVLLASFHHQIDRLKSETRRVEDLQAMVREAVASRSDVDEAVRDREARMAKLDGQLADIQRQLVQSSQTEAETQRLRHEVEEARLEGNRFKAEIARDVNRTRELVDAYHREVRDLDREARDGLTEANAHLRTLAERVVPDPRVLDRELLAPTVQLNGDDTVGSGTLVHSAFNPRTGRNETYVLTSYHVVRNILSDTPSARRRGIAVTIYRAEGNAEEFADMVSHDERIDAALLLLRGERQFGQVARTLPRERTSQVRVWERVYAVGCPLGNDPIPTQGEVSSTHNELNGSNYWMINAPTYFGNSGGGVYLADSRELVGVFSKIYTHGKGNPVVVPHMGLCTPIELVYEWLARDGLEFVLRQPDATELSPDDLTAAPPAAPPAAPR